MEELINQYRYLVGGYYGVCLMDEYPLKEYMLKDIEKYIDDFIEINPIDGLDYKEVWDELDKLPPKRKLQDALLVLHKMKGPMDLVLMIKDKIKNMDS